MGTNYYRVPKSHEVVEKMQKLNMRVNEMDLWSASEAKNQFRTIPITEYQNATPWDEFIDGMSVHLGKRSGGWKFCWNFHNNEYYSNKKELLKFIRTGRVVDEYGAEIEPEAVLIAKFRRHFPSINLLVRLAIPKPARVNPVNCYSSEVLL